MPSETDKKNDKPRRKTIEEHKADFAAMLDAEIEKPLNQQEPPADTAAQNPTPQRKTIEEHKADFAAALEAIDMMTDKPSAEEEKASQDRVDARFAALEAASTLDLDAELAAAQAPPEPLFGDPEPEKTSKEEVSQDPVDARFAALDAAATEAANSIDLDAELAAAQEPPEPLFGDPEPEKTSKEEVSQDPVDARFAALDAAATDAANSIDLDAELAAAQEPPEPLFGDPEPEKTSKEEVSQDPVDARFAALDAAATDAANSIDLDAELAAAQEPPEPLFGDPEPEKTSKEEVSQDPVDARFAALDAAATDAANSIDLDAELAAAQEPPEPLFGDPEPEKTSKEEVSQDPVDARFAALDAAATDAANSIDLDAELAAAQAPAEPLFAAEPAKPEKPEGKEPPSQPDPVEVKEKATEPESQKPQQATQEKAKAAPPVEKPPQKIKIAANSVRRQQAKKQAKRMMVIRPPMRPIRLHKTAAPIKASVQGASSKILKRSLESSGKLAHRLQKSEKSAEFVGKIFKTVARTVTKGLFAIPLAGPVAAFVIGGLFKVVGMACRAIHRAVKRSNAKKIEAAKPIENAKKEEGEEPSTPQMRA